MYKITQILNIKYKCFCSVLHIELYDVDYAAHDPVDPGHYSLQDIGFIQN